MRPMSFTRALVVAGLAATVLTACTPTVAVRSTSQPAATPSPATTEEPLELPALDWAPDTTADPRDTKPQVPEGRTDRFKKDWIPGELEPTLGEWLSYAVTPPGRRKEIALRFAQALQRHDDFGAGLELSLMRRDALANIGDPQLHAYMADIRRHAGLSAAPDCTGSRDLDADSALVTCGPTAVVVHLSDILPGVIVDGWTVHDDVFRGPHTHAFTSLDPSDL